MKRSRCTSKRKRAARARSSSERSSCRRASSAGPAASEARQTCASPAAKRGRSGPGDQASATLRVPDPYQVRPQLAAELVEHLGAVVVEEEVAAGEGDEAEVAARLLLPRLHLPERDLVVRRAAVGGDRHRQRRPG